MKKEFLFKSGINIDIPLIFCIFAFFTFNPIWLISEKSIYKLIIALSIPLILYLLLYFCINRCYFYDDWFEIKYFFRCNGRIIRYNYNEISSIKYICTYSRFRPSAIIIKLNKKGLIRKNLSFSFPLRSYDNRRDLLRYLANKGLIVEIDSIHEKDQDLLNFKN